MNKGKLPSSITLSRSDAYSIHLALIRRINTDRIAGLIASANRFEIIDERLMKKLNKRVAKVLD